MVNKLLPVFFLGFLVACSSPNQESETPLLPVDPPEISLPDSIEDPFYQEQWYLHFDADFYNLYNIDPDAHIHAADYLIQHTGIGIKVAIIDDGLDLSHEDLQTAVTRTINVDGGSDVSHNSFDDFHGTAITGILGARSNSLGIKGVASNAELFFLKYSSNISDSELIRLFYKAEEWGADVINNSWGTGNVSQALKDTIVELSRHGRQGKGINIVFAAGNDSQDMGNDEASIPEVISVASTDEDNLRAVYSDFGRELDVVAPGGYTLGMTTLDPMGDKGIASIDENYLLFDDAEGFIGTSTSAPIVSGVIALLLEINPELTSTQVSDLLHNTADKVGTLDYVGGRNNYYGYGKVNLSKAIEALN